MTQFEKFKTMSLEEMVEWLDEYAIFDDSPWMEFWDSRYCNNCPVETMYAPDYGREMKFAWCELHDKCKFFPDMPDVPDNKDIIRMWLERELDETEE